MQDRDNCMCTIATVRLSDRLLLLPACQIVTGSKSDVTTCCCLSNYRHLSVSRWSSNICTWNIVVYVPKTCPVDHNLSKGCYNSVPRENVANGCYYLWYLVRVTSGGQFRKKLRGHCLYWFKYGVDIHTRMRAAAAAAAALTIMHVIVWQCVSTPKGSDSLCAAFTQFSGS